MAVLGVGEAFSHLDLVCWAEVCLPPRELICREEVHQEVLVVAQVEAARAAVLAEGREELFLSACPVDRAVREVLEAQVALEVPEDREGPDTLGRGYLEGKTIHSRTKTNNFKFLDFHKFLNYLLGRRRLCAI